MPLVNAKCTNCGANLTVDDAKDAAVCEFCGAAYIVEKAVRNYHIENHNHIQAQTVNIYNYHYPVTGPDDIPQCVYRSTACFLGHDKMMGYAVTGVMEIYSTKMEYTSLITKRFPKEWMKSVPKVFYYSDISELFPTARGRGRGLNITMKNGEKYTLGFIDYNDTNSDPFSRCMKTIEKNWQAVKASSENMGENYGHCN